MRNSLGTLILVAACRAAPEATMPAEPTRAPEPARDPEPEAVEAGVTVSGTLRFFKTDEPIAEVRLTMCDRSYAARDCEGAPDVVTTVTGTDGRFTFEHVVVGDLVVVVEPLPDAEACQEVFEPEPFYVDAETCPGPGACELGVVRHCWPFEMPPEI